LVDLDRQDPSRNFFFYDTVVSFMRSMFSLASAFTAILISTFAVLISTSISQAQVSSPSETQAVQAMRAAVLIRLDPRTPVYDEANDRGATRTVEAVESFVRVFELQVSRGQIEDAKQSIHDIFSLLPESNEIFATLLSENPRNAPTLVKTLRAAITKASEVSTANATLRTLVLERVAATMESHVDLAARNGPAYLQLFNKWTYPIVGWKYLASDPRTHVTTRENLLDYARSLSAEERARIAQSEAAYKRGFSTMMCPRMFTPAK
jgi:hypothetical protein